MLQFRKGNKKGPMHIRNHFVSAPNALWYNMFFFFYFLNKEMSESIHSLNDLIHDHDGWTLGERQLFQISHIVD